MFCHHELQLSSLLDPNCRRFRITLLAKQRSVVAFGTSSSRRAELPSNLEPCCGKIQICARVKSAIYKVKNFLTHEFAQGKLSLLLSSKPVLLLVHCAAVLAAVTVCSSGSMVAFFISRFLIDVILMQAGIG